MSSPRLPSASEFKLRRAARAVRTGGVIAYPTEAVYGLGCDPADEAAVMRLLTLKSRPIEKGLIVIGAHFDALLRWLEPPDDLTLVQSSWPGPVTWLLPARADTPRWLRGDHQTLAVRVTAHPIAARLCELCGGALVSTSANVAGRRPARDPLAVRRQFGTRLNGIVSGAVDRTARPSEIRTLQGRVLRSG